MGIISGLFNNTITLKQSGVRITHPRFFSKFKYYEHDQGDGKWKVFVSGDKLDITGTKNDDDITYYGSKSKIDLKEGHDTIFVQGSENEINNPAVVEVKGLGNDVYAKEDAQININGSKNDIATKKNAQINIMGNHNTVFSDFDEKQIVIKEGKDNTIVDKIHESTATTTVDASFPISAGKSIVMVYQKKVVSAATEVTIKEILERSKSSTPECDGIKNKDLNEIINFIKRKVQDNGKDTTIYVR